MGSVQFYASGPALFSVFQDPIVLYKFETVVLLLGRIAVLRT